MFNCRTCPTKVGRVVTLTCYIIKANEEETRTVRNFITSSSYSVFQHNLIEVKTISKLTTLPVNFSDLAIFVSELFELES